MVFWHIYWQAGKARLEERGYKEDHVVLQVGVQEMEWLVLLSQIEWSDPSSCLQMHSHLKQDSTMVPLGNKALNRYTVLFTM